MRFQATDTFSREHHPPPYETCNDAHGRLVTYPSFSENNHAAPNAPSINLVHGPPPVNSPILPVPLLTGGLFTCKINYDLPFSSNNIGIFITYINKNVIVCKIDSDSPLVSSNLKVGDHILEINKKAVQDYPPRKIRELFLLKRSGTIVVRARPYHKIYYLKKDKMGKIGLTVKKGIIIAMNSETEILRKELLGKMIVEVNGVSTIGFSDYQLERFCESCTSQVIITTIPIEIYEQMRLWNVSYH